MKEAATSLNQESVEFGVSALNKVTLMQCEQDV
jgi:hypothetical protein